MGVSLYSIVIVIPAFNPGQRLVRLLGDLTEAVGCRIVVINDGSGPSAHPIFDAAAAINNVTVLSNAMNLGKGAALKYGINYALTNFENVSGIVTADADGQHTVKDIAAVAAELRSNPTSLVLGARVFGPQTPLRSKLGNEASRAIYRIVLGLRLKDTQTGLRGLPLSFARASLAIRSNRYEFETEQLSLAAGEGIGFREVQIETIYEDNNASSHFNPIFDSARIYFVVLRYALSSIATTLVDLIAFFLLSPMLGSVIWSNLASRAIAIGVQYLLLQSFVFRSYSGIWRFVLFVGYVALTGLVSGTLQSELSAFSGLGIMSAKVLVETLIFIFNFLFLRDIMFSRRKHEREDN